MGSTNPKPTTLSHHLVFLLIFISISTVIEAHGQTLDNIVHDHGTNATKFRTYIVHVQKPKGTKFLTFGDRKKWYWSFLPNATLNSGEPRMIYAYRQAISGFAAVLTPEELEATEAKEGFLLAYPEQEMELRTTYSPAFLGLSQWGGLWFDTDYGQCQIIAVLDTGIKYSHPSFDDKGMPPPPPKWKGTCFWKGNACNNKLIGAVGFRKGRLVTPNDTSDNGHGTHTASTAAGSRVHDASVLGNARGMASGLAPAAHLAVYKVLPGGGAEMLKGADEAIRDHVDVLSMSLGYSSSYPTLHDDRISAAVAKSVVPLYEDNIAIASFAAVTKGIVPVQAVGNEGPIPSLIDAAAPWIISVGSSTMDRRLRASVRLGDGSVFHGESGYQPANFTSDQLPLVYPYAILKTDDSKMCGFSINSIDFTGKIVLCENSKTALLAIKIVKDGGGAAVVIMSRPLDGNKTDALPPLLAASYVTYNNSVEILRYLHSSSNATASISFQGTIFQERPTPTVSSFSNRGPYPGNGNIIKPDIVAPGSNILAACPFGFGPPPIDHKKTFIAYSGTSMAAPHVSGIVALLRNSHPQWSPAAIKSAIMTTAYTKDTDGNPIKDQYDGSNAGAFTMGSGHIDPVAANDPGLIYDILPHDYIRYLCGLKLTDVQLTAIVRAPTSCSQIQAIDPEQLNYPSISVYLGPNSMTKTISRTVTNVGDANSMYSIIIDNPEGMNVAVSPTTLQFSQPNEEQVFSVTLSIQGIPPVAGKVSEGQLSWDSGKYLVRSPVVVTFT